MEVSVVSVNSFMPGVHLEVIYTKPNLQLSMYDLLVDARH